MGRRKAYRLECDVAGCIVQEVFVDKGELEPAHTDWIVISSAEPQPFQGTIRAVAICPDHKIRLKE